MKKIKLVLRVLILVAITGLYVGCSFLFGDAGKRGPGGGLIFYDSDVAYECSDVLGKATWKEALVLAKNYKGGGYSDWYLPDTKELMDIDEDLYDHNYISDTEMVWSASEGYNDAGYARPYKFGGSHAYLDSFKSVPYNVRAVRRL